MSSGSSGVGADQALYKQAIDCCDMLFQYAAEVGHKFTVLDIGGGFSESTETFLEIAPNVAKYVAKFTEKYPRIRVLAEPGNIIAVHCIIVSWLVLC